MFKSFKTKTIYLFIGLLIGCLFPIQSIFADQPIKLIINGQQIQCDVPPQNINGRVMVPARFVAEPLGAEVDWDGENRAVIIKSKVSQEQIQTPTQTQDNSMQNNNVKTNLPKEEPKSNNENNNTNQVETLRDYYIQGDVPCIKYNETVYVPILAGLNYYNISTNDSNFTYNPNNKSITFKNINRTYIAGNMENNDDYIYYQSRTYIKEDILKTIKN